MVSESTGRRWNERGERRKMRNVHVRGSVREELEIDGVRIRDVRGQQRGARCRRPDRHDGRDGRRNASKEETVGPDAAAAEMRCGNGKEEAVECKTCARVRAHMGHVRARGWHEIAVKIGQK